MGFYCLQTFQHLPTVLFQQQSLLKVPERAKASQEKAGQKDQIIHHQDHTQAPLLQDHILQAQEVKDVLTMAINCMLEQKEDAIIIPGKVNSM